MRKEIEILLFDSIILRKYLPVEHCQIVLRTYAQPHFPYVRYVVSINTVHQSTDRVLSRDYECSDDPYPSTRDCHRYFSISEVLLLLLFDFGSTLPAYYVISQPLKLEL